MSLGAPPPPPSSAASSEGGERKGVGIVILRSFYADRSFRTWQKKPRLLLLRNRKGGVFFFLFRLCVLYPSPEIIQICRLAPKKAPPPRGGPSPPLSYVHTGLQGGGIEQGRFRVGRKENEEGWKRLELLPPLPPPPSSSPPSIPTCHQRKRRRVTKVDPGGRLLRTVCTETSPRPPQKYILYPFPRFFTTRHVQPFCSRRTAVIKKVVAVVSV